MNGSSSLPNLQGTLNLSPNLGVPLLKNLDEDTVMIDLTSPSSDPSPTLAGNSVQAPTPDQVLAARNLFNDNLSKAFQQQQLQNFSTDLFNQVPMKTTCQKRLH